MRNQMKTYLLFFILIQTMAFLPEVSAQAPGNPAISPEELERSIREVMRQRKYAWRMPKEKLPEKEARRPSGPFATLAEWFSGMFGKFGRTLKKWGKAFSGWLDKYLPQGRHDKNDASEGKSGLWVRKYFHILTIFLAIILGGFLWRTWRKRKTKQEESAEKAGVILPDLDTEDVLADSLPADDWLALAGKLLEKEELRKAVRALYLAMLAHLGQQGMIRIAAYKSNRDYEQEIGWRSHEHKELLPLFSAQAAFFDRVWYGMHDLTRQDVERFSENRERMAIFVREQ